MLAKKKAGPVGPTRDGSFAAAAALVGTVDARLAAGRPWLWGHLHRVLRFMGSQFIPFAVPHVIASDILQLQRCPGAGDTALRVHQFSVGTDGLEVSHDFASPVGAARDYCGKSHDAPNTCGPAVSVTVADDGGGVVDARAVVDIHIVGVVGVAAGGRLALSLTLALRLRLIGLGAGAKLLLDPLQKFGLWLLVTELSQV